MPASSWRVVLVLLAIGSPLDLSYADSLRHGPEGADTFGMGPSYAPSITLASAPASRAVAVSGNSPLELTAPTSVAVAQGKPVSILAQAIDPDGGKTLTVTVLGAPSFLSLSGAAGSSPLTATLSGVASPSDAGIYEIVWNVSGSGDKLAAKSWKTTLTVGGAALDLPETPGASIVGYTTYGDNVVVSEGTNGINARLGVWGAVWPWAFCQQEVGYPCTRVANRIVVDIDVQAGARLSFSFEFMEYGTPFLQDDLQAVVSDGFTGEAPLWNYGNPKSCWGNLWQSPRRDISFDLSKWPNRHVTLDIWVRDCLGHQTDALALIHSIAIRECYVTPLAPLSAEDQAMFELKPPVESQLTTEMKTALACLRSAVMAADGSLVVRSAYRTQSYQSHLYELYTKWKKLEPDTTTLECQDLRTQLKNHIHDHQMDSLKIAPASDAGLHPKGLALSQSHSSLKCDGPTCQAAA